MGDAAVNGSAGPLDMARVDGWEGVQTGRIGKGWAGERPTPLDIRLAMLNNQHS